MEKPAHLRRRSRRVGDDAAELEVADATSLSIPVVAGQIGVSLGLISAQSYVALVAAGLLSVVVFPLVALPLLMERRAPSPATDARAQLSA